MLFFYIFSFFCIKEQQSQFDIYYSLIIKSGLVIQWHDLSRQKSHVWTYFVPLPLADVHTTSLTLKQKPITYFPMDSLTNPIMSLNLVSIQWICAQLSSACQHTVFASFLWSVYPGLHCIHSDDLILYWKMCDLFECACLFYKLLFSSINIRL